MANNRENVNEKDDVLTLYNNLKDDGYEDLGTADEFRQKVADRSMSDQLYNNLKEDGYEDLGTADDFFARLNPADKEDNGEIEMPDTSNNYVQPQFDATQIAMPQQNEKSNLEKAVSDFVGGPQWRDKTVALPGENPYNGRTYGEVYDQVIQDFGKNMNHPDIDQYAEARAQIMQAGITDDMNPDEADNLALQIREGYANKYAGINAQAMVKQLPDQVPNIDQLMDAMWYNRDLHGKLSHEAQRLGLSHENYINFFMKPQLAKALSDRYGYDVNSANHIAGRLLSGEGHTMERVRQGEANEMVERYAEPKIQEYFDRSLRNAENKFNEQMRVNDMAGNMMATGNEGRMMGTALNYYSNTDPAKIWEEIKPNIDALAQDIVDVDFVIEADKHAEEEGVDVNQWLRSRVEPYLESQIQSTFERMALEREMPKDTMDYLIAEARRSIIGSVFNAALASKARRRMQGEALQRTEMGQGKYKPGFGAQVGGAVASMLPDMMFGGPFGWSAKGAAALMPLRGTAQELMAEGMRPIVARMIESSLIGSQSLGTFEAIKGGIEGAGKDRYDSYFDEDKRSATEILKDIVEGSIEHGTSSAIMGATMVGGPVGQKISNGRGLLANIAGWGTQVGIDAGAATALSIPQVISGDITLEDLGREFANSVGTFAALGLHHKAKEFASLADGGRAWNGVAFTKKDIETLESRFLLPLRQQITEIESAQNRRGLIGNATLGIDAKEEQREAVNSAGAFMYNDLMHSYAVPRELKVKVSQALGMPIPEYALKPEVLELEKQATAKGLNLGWIDYLNSEYNKPDGVADKLRQGKRLTDSELALRLVFQDNAAYNEAVKKQQAGEELTEQEQELIEKMNNRLHRIFIEHEYKERRRLATEFENEHDLEPGTMARMMRDAAEGKAVESNLLNEYEQKLRDYNRELDEAEVAKQAVEETPVEEAPIEESVMEEAPKVNRVEDEAPVVEETPVEEQAEPQSLVNDQTGTIQEVELLDGRKAYIKSIDATNGLISFVDEQGRPVTMTDKNGYTINKFPESFIKSDGKGQPIINEVKPEEAANDEAPKAEESKTENAVNTDNVPEEKPVSRIKTAEDGTELWEEATAEDAAAELRDRAGDDALAIVDEQIADVESQLKELTKPAKGKKHMTMSERLGMKQAIKDGQKSLDFWNQVKAELEKPAETVEEPKPVEEPKVEDQKPITQPAEPAKPVEPAQPAGPTAEQKVAQGTVKNNIGKRFGFQNNDGTHSEVTIDVFKGDDLVTVTRQDYDINGQPKGEVYQQDLKLTDVGNAIVNGMMKPALTTDEKLRKVFKVTVGDIPLADVLTEAEQQQLLDLIAKKDNEAVGSLTGDLIDAHHEDLILRGRDIRNAKVDQILNGNAGREEKLRRIRQLYNPDIVESYLSDEALYPSSAEEWVAELNSRVPKKGEGPLAYFTYEKDGSKIVGMQGETGFGTKNGGDNQGYAPWLAPQGKGMSLQKYGELLHSQLPEAVQEQFTDQDMRNAVRDVFGGAERPSDITTMIIRRGIIQAENAARRQEEMWIDGGPNMHKVSIDDNSFTGRLERAKKQTNTEPTEGQKEAGNYKKGHISFGGYDLTIENPAGSVRRGEADGKKWEQKMNNTYGYILGKFGKDGDHLDMFINDAADLDNWNGKVYVVDQVNPKTGEFDEHKVMYGFDSEAEARDAYLSNYEKGWKGLGKITGVDKETFDSWLDSSKRKRIPFAEHSIPKEALSKQQAQQPVTEAEIDKALMKEVMKAPAEKGVQFVTDVEEGQKVIDDYNNSKATGDSVEDDVKAQKVSDQEELDQLENGKTVKRYRAMQLIDGKLYPPMSAKVDGEMREPTEIGVWEKAEERPDLVKNGKFVLNKGQKGQSNVPAAYNPYFHTSTSGLNDQFTSAYKRPELVVVEVEIPESELTSGYKAEGAKDAVGDVDWHSGVVNGQLPADRQRQVTLSRYSKVKRIVPDSEVAEMIAKQLEGTDIEIPYNVVTPAQRAELEKRGVKISDKPAGTVTEDINGNRLRQQKVEQPVFVSNALQAVEGIKQEKGTAEQWLAMLQKAGGLKAGEDKWLGLSDWLNEHKGEKLTKQDVLDFIRQNQIQVEEQHYAEGMPKNAQDKLDAFNAEFEELIWEGGEATGSIYTSDWIDWAYDQMVERYGDEFRDAFDIGEGTGTNSRLTPTTDYTDNMSKAAEYYLGIENAGARPIESTRMDYTTDGLENKKEIALTVPTIEPYNEGDQIHFGDAGGGRAVAWARFGDTTIPVKEKVYKKVDELEEPWDNSRGSLVYWPKGMKDGKDYIVYGKTRNGDYKYGVFINEAGIGTWDTLEEAKENMNAYYQNHPKTKTTGNQKVLVIDEIQSKRHQDAREKGYITKEYQQELERLTKAYRKTQRELDDFEKHMIDKYDAFEEVKTLTTEETERRLRNMMTEAELEEYDNLLQANEQASMEKSKFVLANGDLSRKVPEAPFEKNWHELAMKRMLRYAAENGYDKIAWTTGEQQAERYSLSKAFNSIEREDNPSQEGKRFVFSGGNVEVMRVDDEGKVISSTIGDADGKNLSDLVGKDMAVKLMGMENGDMLEGENLRIGGEGMKGFYDDILPRFMNKYGKKWGVKVDKTELPDIGQTMWSIDVTPEMKESVMQGQPMFFKTPDGQAYGFTYKGKIYVDPRIATSETPIHEYGHLWAEMKRQTSPEEWSRIKQALLGDKLIEPIIEKVRREYPELTGEGKEDDFVEEVLTQFSGKHGAEKLRKMAQEIKEELGNDATAATIAEVAVRRVKSILNEFWKGVCDMMGWQYRNAEDVADAVLRDMLNGVNPNEERVKAGRGRASRADGLKQRQLDTILKENPADDENMPGHTWIRTINDIKTFREAVDEDGYAAEEGVTPDFTADMVKDALEKGVVTVYSSKPIKDGAFVTPSKMEATNYAGGGKVYSKEVPLTDVAWIDPLQGQYAKVSDDMKSQKMDYTSDEEKQRTETIFNAAKKLFGTTYDIREAGYILPDGSMPDFSGRHQMNPGSDTSFLRGRRSTDHREVESIAYERDGNTKTGIETDMPDFIRRGAIRIDDNAGAINLSVKPTNEQKKALRQLIAHNDGYVQVDFGDGWDSDHYVEYDGAKPSRVLADIDRYFDEGIKPQGDAPKYQLVGRKGAEKADEAEGTTMRQDNMKVAEEMEKAGKDIRAIKLATGWERGKDGQWRYETVDADVDVLTPYEKKLQEMKDEGVENPMPILKLQELLGKDNELFKYYPQMRNVQVMFDPTVESGIAGSTDGKTIELNANETSRFGDKKLDNENVYGTLLHEVQHIIQAKEGFAQGGSLSTATTEAGMEAIMNKKERQRSHILKQIEVNRKILDSGDELEEYAELGGFKTVKEYREHLNGELDELAAKYDNLTAQIDRIYKLKTVAKSDAADLYRSLAGEVEARNVTERMGMSEQERRNNPAAKTEDVSREEQVVIMDYPERESMSMTIDEIEGIKPFHDLIDEMFTNPDFDKASHNRDRYFFGKTPEYMKKVGIAGDDFSLSFKNIKTHQGKDSDHALTQEEWHQLPAAIKKPFLITKLKGSDDKFRLFVNIFHNGHPVAVGIDVKRINQGKNKPMLEVNSIKTVFGHKDKITDNQEIVTYDEKMTPEQEALLRDLDYREYPSIQELSGSKDTKNNSNFQENGQENAELLREGEAQQVELGAKQRKLTPKQMRERQAYAERQWRRAHEWANDTVEKLKIGDKVTIVDSIDELKDYKKFSARKKNAKGWYDPETDSIVIVMGNHRSPSDVVKTILHEAVAHHGLRKLFGGNYDTFLDNAYKSATFEIRDSIDELANKYDGDVRKATEEYMGKLAEDTEFENAENRPWVHHWFNQIKKLFLDMLDKIGLNDFVYKGREATYGDIGLTLTDNELRYILWRSYKNLTEPDAYRNVFQQAEDIAMRNKLAKEVKMPVKGRIEDEIPQMLRNHNDEIAIQKRVSQMSLQEAQEAYKRIDEMMRDEQGRDLDEQFEAHKMEYREKNGLDGIGKFMADDLKAAMDKYGSGMVELRWELADRIEQLGGSTVAGEGKELYRDGEDEAPRFQRVSPEPEMTDEQRQYWKQWDADMKKWKERNALPMDAQEPGEETPKGPDEDAMDYVLRIAKHRMDKALWKTAPKLEDYHTVRTDKDSIEAARENLERYPESPSAKMRLIAAEAQRLRHAMSRQKAYDKATVKAVTDFAQEYMKLGFGDNLRRSEVERLLSTVKNATGAKDIRSQVDNIMNILTDNYLRNLDQQVTNLSSIKELRQTAQGVEHQGKLELKGQRMIQAFREARQERMTADDIRRRIGEVSEYMARNDEEAPMWEQEYEGLSIALQYAENIDASRSEYKELDDEYRDAVKNYKQSGRTYQQQQEYLDTLEKAMMENKLERIGMFGDIIGRLEGNIAESMQGAREFVEREKQRVRHIQEMANFDLAGKDMGAMRENSKGKPANFFLQPLATFEQMLRQFGSRNANGEGYLYNYFMRNWADANGKAFLNEQAAKEELDEKARDVFGDKIKRWSDLYKLIRNEEKFPGMDVQLLDQDEPKTFHLNQGNLLYIYMANKMNDGAMKLRRMGITEEDVAAIKEHLDNRLVQLADWLQEEYLPQKRIAYNKVHERMFGAPMATIENYYPIRVLGDARYQEQDVNVPDSETLPSTITGNIIKRRKNTLPLDILHTDALSLAVEHIEDMERWAATAEWNKDVNTLLSYTTFRNKVKNMDTIYGSGDALWNTFKDAAKMAAGVYNPSTKSGHVDKTISNIAKGVTAAKISFRMYTAFKQILSAPAFLHDVNMADFAKNAVNPYGSWKWAMENMPLFQKRWKSRQAGDTRLMDDPTDWKMWKEDIVQLATRMGMSPNALVDGITCAVGARSIYESRIKRYKKMGLSDEEAEKRALQDAEIGYNLTQQSSEGAFVSAIQKDRTVAANMLSVFRNSSMAYTRQWVDAARNLKHRMQPGYKEDSIKFMKGQFMNEFGMDEDQAQQFAEAEYDRAGRHDIARMLNMMFGVTVAWNLGASLPYLLIGDNWDTKKEMMTDALLKGLIAGPSEGFAAGNIISELVGRSIASEETRKTFQKEGLGAAADAAIKQAGDYEVNPLPLFADIQGMIKKMGYDKFAALQDVFNIVMQSAVGVNPQTFTDVFNAVMDYAAPGWDGTDYNWNPENMLRAKELALFLMRLTNAPTSSWRNKYIDELEMGADEASKLTYDEMAKRYAHYKHWKDNPFMGWLRGEAGREKKMESIRKQFDKAVQERMDRLQDEELLKTYDQSDDKSMMDMIGKNVSKRIGGKDLIGKSTSKKPEVQASVDYYVRNRTGADLMEDLQLEAFRRKVQADVNDGSATQEELDVQKEMESTIKSIKKERDQMKPDGENTTRWQNIRKMRADIMKKIAKVE